ncbi:hypothetical protein [Psychroserpens sp. NJDZ02]|uniref:hypothetical protein n=1 Tax=Psychroserpens sp. NJDZ02 TaxID=2570561 RepID=UPI0010A8921C|nr:hypothetical protein [Psychroserpens sp. NJDZ02]QCE42987.1 hypothetical protein E9099_16715 [Psychroserpens sp. NJDZ02]
MEKLKQGLTIPMYVLHYIDSMEDLNEKIEKINFLKKEYPLDDRKNIFASLEWAMDNKDYNFLSLMSYANDRFSNNDIFQYLNKLYILFKQRNLNIS